MLFVHDEATLVCLNNVLLLKDTSPGTTVACVTSKRTIMLLMINPMPLLTVIIKPLIKEYD